MRKSTCVKKDCKLIYRYIRSIEGFQGYVESKVQSIKLQVKSETLSFQIKHYQSR